jgi:hypothetical protein
MGKWVVVDVVVVWPAFSAFQLFSLSVLYRLRVQ